MHKTNKMTLLALSAAVALLLPAGAQARILDDAAATCGSRLMFSADRTFDNATSLQQIDSIYGCVDSYLNGLPEYKNSSADKAGDARFIAAVRQIDTGRATGQLTAEQARIQMQTATAGRN